MNRAYPTRINWENNPPSIATPLNDTNLNKMDLALYEIDGRVVEFDLTKANQSDLLQTIKTLTYNTETGVFTFTFWNGSTYTVDLNIEKIPVDFSMDEYGVITMTTADGTQYTCDISELVKVYTFVDSSEIDFTVTTDASGNKNVTAVIKDGSIVGSKLQPNFLADCQAASSQAQTAAGNASISATTAESSSEDSEAWAVGERNGVPVPSTDPAYENNAKYWAQHGSNSFAGLTDTDFTNLQNGQIAKYNATTQKWENVNESGGGGLLPHLYIDSEAGSTVTVVAPDSSVITPTQISSGHWECDVPSYGVYTIHAVLNGDDAVLSLTVDDVKEYHVTDSHYSYTLNVYAPTGSTIRVTATGETYTGTGAGSTAVQFALHQASTTYSIQVTLDGVSKTDSVTTPSTSGGTGSKTFEFGTINVALDTEFVGETITCVNGGTTISKTASSTSLVFYPPTTGTWTISGTISGTTYSVDAVVSSLSTPVSVVLQTTPEGSTVLPTDDIQTWLACAGITDKSYTTLNEVLADSTTLLALMSNNNAVDYLVRSTTWASGITADSTAMTDIGANNYCANTLLSDSTWLNAICNSTYFESVLNTKVPTMTSNTTPSGEASGLNYNNTYPPYLVFDGNDSTFCAINAPSNTGTGMTDRWVQYSFTDAVKVNKFLMKYRDTYSAQHDYITKVKLQGSDDGNIFEDITIETISSTTEEKSFINDKAYEYYRFLIVDGTVTNYGQISWMILTLQLYGRASS